MIKKIEDLLVENGEISQSQLNWAKLRHNETGLPLYKILIQEGLVTEDKYFVNLSKIYDKDFIRLDPSVVNRELLNSLPRELLEKYNFIPLEKTIDGIKIATYDPSNFFMFQEIEQLTGYKSDFCITNVSSLLSVKKSLGIGYSKSDEIEKLRDISLDDVAVRLKEGYSTDEVAVDEDLENYDVAQNDAPVVVLVNKLIYDAVKSGATDIHIECFEFFIKVRYRIDGILFKVMEIEKNAQEAVVTRLKIMSDLDITERFIPQDGRFKMKIMESNVDFRITFLPSMYGQNISIRIFNKKNTPLAFEDIGISENFRTIIMDNLKKHYGLVLTVGPTGSGKTTTLYTMLNRINSEDIKIVTIEDPVEYRIEGIHQIQVKINREDPKKSLTFAGGLKAILRQDPNVIMIGEIRDRETAEIAINAALTGHLVFSTIHANTTVEVISRLKHLGINHELISDALSLIIAQRLVRKVCDECRGNVEKIGGCSKCKNTGYSGRTGIFELLQIDDKIKEMIAKDEPGVFIRKYAQTLPYWKSLEMDADIKMKTGLINSEEVERLII
ncbi:MAG: GspE/PulE family protein [Candidatus Muiribacteriota bacterium]